MCSANVEPSGVWKEARWMRAWELVQQGWKQRDVAEAMGASKGAVSQWVSQARAGHRGLAPPPAARRGSQAGRPAAGATAGAAGAGPGAGGFGEEIWTLPRVAQVIEQEYGVSCHPTQVGRILKDCGWSGQQPVLRASQRDEDAIRDWWERRFAELKTRP